MQKKCEEEHCRQIHDDEWRHGGWKEEGWSHEDTWTGPRRCMDTGIWYDGNIGYFRWKDRLKKSVIETCGDCEKQFTISQWKPTASMPPRCYFNYFSHYFHPSLFVCNSCLNPLNVFCSLTCQIKWLESWGYELSGICHNCGNLTSNKKHKYCSDDCRQSQREWGELRAYIPSEINILEHIHNMKR